MASIHETHSGVAGVTPQGQPRTLHGTADDASRTARETTAMPPDPRPVRSITRGKAKSSQRTDSKESRARKRQPSEQEPRPRANRVLVLDAHGKPLMPCTPRRARQLINARRVAKRFYRPFTIQLKDRSADDGNTASQPVELRTTPGARRTGIALVALLKNEELTLYQEEIQHRTDISTRLQERKSYRGRRRGERWYRAPRFNNRRRATDQLPPSLESVISNQEHRIGRLAARSGAASVVLQDTKFDTQKVLNPGIHGKEYQQGPLYKSHLREYVAEQWKHRCAYCDRPDWQDRTRFELDHVVPRSRNGPTNIGNIVWSCHPCNQAKSDSDLETFLGENPDRSTAVRTREDLRPPLAAAGAIAWICQTLRKRLSAQGLKIRRTTGADTAHRRRELGITKNHANDAACCSSSRPVTELRRPAVLKAVGHGRRKQIKSLPVGRYLAWRHQPPAERRKTPCPGHARHPNVVYGMGSGDLVQIRSGNSWVKGRAQVEAARQRVAISAGQRSVSTGRNDHVRLIAPRNGYRESN